MGTAGKNASFDTERRDSSGLSHSDQITSSHPQS